MKIKVKHWLTETRYEGCDPTYALFPFKFDGENYAIVSEMDVELEIPDSFDSRAQRIEALEKQRQKAIADHQVFMDTIEGKIQSLRCIEHKEVA